MSERTLTLSQRRAALRAHCTLQREQLAHCTDRIQARLGAVDRGIAVIRRYAAQPVLLVGGFALFALVGPSRLLRWTGRGMVFITAGRRLFRFLR